jgi:hypothetical protein
MESSVLAAKGRSEDLELIQLPFFLTDGENNPTKAVGNLSSSEIHGI